MKHAYTVAFAIWLSFGVVAPSAAAEIAGVSKSDDYRSYRAAFQGAAKKLVANGTCTETDLADNGGFVRSVNRRGYYFTYCGGFHLRNRIYVKPQRNGRFEISR